MKKQVVSKPTRVTRISKIRKILSRLGKAASYAIHR